jgi:hypothetical protein
MRTDLLLKIGKTMFALALMGMGAMHLTSGHFLFDFPVPVTFMGGSTIPAYVNGVMLIIAGVLMLAKKQALSGALLAALIFLAFFVVRHILLLIRWENMPGERTSATECVLFFGGALMLAGLILKSRGTQQRGQLFFIIGEYAFGAALFVFGILHYVSMAFVVSVIPQWISWKEFWAWFVMAGFLAAGISILIQRQVRLSSLLVSLMFLCFICLMHIPLVIAFPGQEVQWTNLFVPIGLSGIGLILASVTVKKR